LGFRFFQENVEVFWVGLGIQLPSKRSAQHTAQRGRGWGGARKTTWKVA